MVGSPARILWLFGLPGAGKTTVARALSELLRSEGSPAVVLDDEELHAGVVADPSTAEAAQAADVLRAAQLARTLSGQGTVVIVALATAKEHQRALAADILGAHLFLACLECSTEVRAQRLPESAGQAGFAEPVFEAPGRSVLRIATDKMTPAQAAQRILKVMRDRYARPDDLLGEGGGRGLRRVLPEGGEPKAVEPARSTMDRKIEKAPDRPAAPVARSLAGTPRQAAVSGGDGDSDRREKPAAAAAAVAGESAPGSVEGQEIPAGGAGLGARRRRSGRFVEKRGIPSSVFIMILATLAGGAMVLGLIWLVRGSLERKDAMERILAGDLSGTEKVVRRIDTASPAERAVKKKAAGEASRPVPQPATTLMAVVQGDSYPGPQSALRPPPKFTRHEPSGADALRGRLVEDLDRYFEARAWQEKVAFVRDPQRAGALMEGFYASVAGPEKPRGAVAQSVFLRAGFAELFLLAFAAPEPGMDPEELCFVKQADGNWKLDWESFVGAGDMTWEAFLKNRPQRATLLRARARVASPPPGEFGDPARYYAVRLDEPRRRGHALLAICENGSAAAQALKELFAEGTMPAVTVRVAFTQSTRTEPSVKLLDVVSGGWLLVE